HTGRIERGPQCGVLDARRLRQTPRAHDQRRLELAVQVEGPRRPVERGRSVVPRVVANRGEAVNGVIETRRGLAGSLLVIGAQHVVAAAKAEEVIRVDVAAVVLAAALVRSGTAFTPPVPVLVAELIPVL